MFKIGVGLALDPRSGGMSGAFLAWILITSFWNDAGVWDDGATWSD